MTNWRFHLIALCGLCLMAFMVLNMSGMMDPPPAAPVVKPQPKVHVPDHFITVWEAHWGFACNDDIKRQNERGRGDTIELVKQNNVLAVVSKECNGKEECAISAKTNDLNIQLPRACRRPRLQVGYRCYSYDRLRRVGSGSGGQVRLSCKYVKK